MKKHSFLQALTQCLPLVRHGAVAMLALFCTQCATQMASDSGSEGAALGSGRGSRTAAARAEMHRSGLGTGFGETRKSGVDSTAFQRSSPRPAGTEKIFYNDRQGVLAAAGDGGGGKFNGWKEIASGLVSIGLKSEGGWLRGVDRGGDIYVIGEPGERYDILLKNETGRRVEAVVSVDGLDVLDGRPASVSKRGYVIPAHGSVRIEGWRTSMNQVAAFRFARVSQSYAALKHGNTRNVGVIGVAVFTSDHPKTNFAEPPYSTWRTGDLERRQQADPFPQSSRWASPP